MTNQSGDATNRGDAMSDIERFDIRCLAVNKRENGDWVRYEDHRAEVERLTAERDTARAEVERLRANDQALLDRSRPTDEDIWREAFMAAVRSRDFHRTKMADEVLAEYRKRWPR